MNWGEFWNMGGFGLYVWGSYGAAVVLFTCEVASLRRRKRALHERLRDARKMERSEP